MAQDEPGFDASKAEMFEAVGHPHRIKIIQALGEGEKGFAELKKKVGMESSGHLAFHPGKLHHLVSTDASGQYTLTGEGREALSMIQAVRERNGERHERRPSPTRRSILAVLVVLVLALALLSASQELQIASLPKPRGTVALDGRAFWFVVVPLSSIPAGHNASFVFDGVNFTLASFQPFGTATLTVTGWNGTASVRITPSNGTFSFIRGEVVTFVLYPTVEVRF